MYTWRKVKRHTYQFPNVLSKGLRIEIRTTLNFNHLTYARFPHTKPCRLPHVNLPVHDNEVVARLMQISFCRIRFSVQAINRLATVWWRNYEVYNELRRIIHLWVVEKLNTMQSLANPLMVLFSWAGMKNWLYVLSQITGINYNQKSESLTFQRYLVEKTH